MNIKKKYVEEKYSNGSINAQINLSLEKKT